MLAQLWRHRLPFKFARSIVTISAPEKSAIDETIEIAVSGLDNDQNVTVCADATRGGVTLSAFAKFQAENGQVDLTKDASLGGSYKGTDGMGLFETMEMTSELKTVFRMVIGNFDYWPYRLRVFDGHYSNYEELKDQTALVECEIQRQFKVDEVQRNIVRFKSLRGFLFMPDPETAPRPCPAVIDIFGGAWGLVAHRASLFARHGYATLAVPYAAYDDLPTPLVKLDMGYFASAFEYLSHLRDIDSTRVGVHGSCLGGTLALALASEIPQIRAASVVSPEPHAGGFDYYFPSAKKIVKACKYQTVKFDLDGELFTNVSQEETLKEAGISGVDAWRTFDLRFGQIKAPLMIFYGSNDMLFKLDITIPSLQQQFKETNKKNHEIILYKGAGHIIQPRYMPMFSRYYSPMFSSLVLYGGEQPYHALAQRDMWSRTLDFFKSHLKEGRADDGPMTPVNIRRDDVTGRILESSDLNTHFRTIEFDSFDNSPLAD